MIAADLRRRRPKPHTIWHLDEVYLKIDGRLVYLWRAVDAEGEVLDVLVQTRRNKRAALKLMRKLLKKYGFVPNKLVTDDLQIYGAAASALGIARRHERGRWRNNPAENSHQPTHEGSARCKVSKAWDPRKDFSQCMQQHKIPSTSSAISPQQNAPSLRASAMQTWRESSLRREPDVPGDLLRAIFGNVTEPYPGPIDVAATRLRPQVRALDDVLTARDPARLAPVTIPPAQSSRGYARESACRIFRGDRSRITARPNHSAPGLHPQRPGHATDRRL